MEELAFLDKCLMRNPKSYGVWHQVGHSSPVAGTLSDGQTQRSSTLSVALVPFASHLVSLASAAGSWRAPLCPHTRRNSPCAQSSFSLMHETVSPGATPQTHQPNHPSPLIQFISLAHPRTSALRPPPPVRVPASLTQRPTASSPLLGLQAARGQGDSGGDGRRGRRPAPARVPVLARPHQRKLFQLLRLALPQHPASRNPRSDRGLGQPPRSVGPPTSPQSPGILLPPPPSQAQRASGLTHRLLHCLL